MQLIQFSGTDLWVSPLALGTVNFGTKLPEADALRQMDEYREAGNFIDTARVYGDWGNGERSVSEKIVGRWLKSRGMTNKIIISTKGGHPALTGPFIARVSRKELESDLNGSLTDLGVDAIDLYFLHRDDASVPVGEILETLDDLRRIGKIRHYGLSNWTLPRIREAAEYAKSHRLEGFVCNQLMWSLAAINRECVKDKTLALMDGETLEYHSQTQMSVMAFTSIAKGYFAHRAEGTSIRADKIAVYDSPLNDEIYASLLRLSRESGLPVSELSLLYFRFQPFPAVAIASFSKEEQLQAGLNTLKRAPDAEIVRRLHALRTDLIGG